MRTFPTLPPTPKLTALERFRQAVDALLEKHKDEIKQAPDHWGLFIPDFTNTGIDDGANYTAERDIPDFIRKDLDGWL